MFLEVVEAVPGRARDQQSATYWLDAKTDLEQGSGLELVASISSRQIVQHRYCCEYAISCPHASQVKLGTVGAG
jgi:hypothetical protein